jgi:Spy/CpxP family protein refolding chaperone
MMQRQFHLTNIALAILVSLVMMFSQSARAQDSQDSTRAARRAAVLKDSLGLNDEQTAKIETIFLQSQKQMSKERDVHQGDREAMMKAMREHMQEMDKQINAVLKPDQQKKYEALMKERRERMRQRMQNQDNN